MKTIITDLDGTLLNNKQLSNYSLKVSVKW